MSSLGEEEGSLGRLQSSAFLVSSLGGEEGSSGRLQSVKVRGFLKGTLKAKVNVQIWGPLPMPMDIRGTCVSLSG